jgi:hypothetical protein
LFQYQAFHMVEYIHADRGEGDRFPTWHFPAQLMRSFRSVTKDSVVQRRSACVAGGGGGGGFFGLA